MDRRQIGGFLAGSCAPADLKLFQGKGLHGGFESCHLPVFSDGFEVNEDDLGKLGNEDLHDLGFGHDHDLDTEIDVLLAVDGESRATRRIAKRFDGGSSVGWVPVLLKLERADGSLPSPAEPPIVTRAAMGGSRGGGRRCLGFHLPFPVVSPEGIGSPRRRRGNG